MIFNKYNIKKIIVGVILVFISGRAYAQNKQSMSWNQCLELATSNNTSIKVSNHSYNSANYTLKASYLKLLPDLDLDASYQKTDLDQFYSWEYKAELRLPNMTNYYLIRSSKSKLTSSEINKRLTYISTIKEIKETFINLGFIHKEIELYEKIIKRSLANKKLSENRYQSGRDARWTFLQSSLVYEQNLQEYDKIKKELVIQNEKLINLIYPVDNHPTSIIYPDLSTIEEKVTDKTQVLNKISQHPQVLLSKSNLEQKEISYHEDLSDFLPDLSVFATYSRHKTHSIIDDEDRWNKTWSVGVTATFKILSSFETYARSSASYETLASSKLTHQQTIEDLKVSIEDAYTKYQNSIDQLKISEMNLDVSRSRASTRQKEYEIGLSDYTDWSNSQDQLSSSERSLLNAQKNKLIALINLNQVIGE